ncbi:MAG: hypothetical protein IJC17_03450 [Clostridia bacterium]|nr:hypothetical protein [Clostridia bacterium]
MKRTSRTNTRKRLTGFFTTRWRLLLFLALLLGGFAVGCVLFVQQPEVWSTRVQPWVTAADSASWLSVASIACLYRWGLLAVLLAAAVSVYGLPFILAVPAIYGGFLGLAQCYWYAQGVGGIGVAAAQVLLPAMLQIWAILMAAAESSRMTVALAGQLLPGGSHVGLWSLWRTCMLRFLLFFGLSLLSAVLETVIRLCF